MNDIWWHKHPAIKVHCRRGELTFESSALFLDYALGCQCEGCLKELDKWKAVLLAGQIVKQRTIP